MRRSRPPQARWQWFGREGLAIIDEGSWWEGEWGYRHFLLRPGR